MSRGVTLNLNDRYHEQLEDYAEEYDIAKVEVVRRLLDQGFHQEESIIKTTLKQSVVLSTYTAIMLAVFGVIYPPLFQVSLLALVSTLAFLGTYLSLEDDSGWDEYALGRLNHARANVKHFFTKGGR